MAAKTKAGIPRGRLVARAVLGALLLGGAWVLVAVHIDEFGGRCLAVKGSVWADAECVQMMTFPPAVAVVSLILFLYLCRREAQAEAKVREAAGGGGQGAIYLPELGFAVGPESCLLRGSDAMAVTAINVIHAQCVVMILLGVAIDYVGSRGSLEDSAEKGAYAPAKMGTTAIIVGCFAFWFEVCFLIIPYGMLMLRRSVRANWVVASSA